MQCLVTNHWHPKMSLKHVECTMLCCSAPPSTIMVNGSSLQLFTLQYLLQQTPTCSSRATPGVLNDIPLISWPRTNYSTVRPCKHNFKTDDKFQHVKLNLTLPELTPIGVTWPQLTHLHNKHSYFTVRIKTL